MSDKFNYTKLERDGKVAVLYSPKYGAGWSTWNSEEAEALLFDADIATAILEDNKELALSIANTKYPNAYKGGLVDLTVAWVDKGTVFEIDEYDGYESVRIISDAKFNVA